ncbi:MAG: DUF1934 domain-containing protein [Clostridiales bacterium]|jgi:uncharacterized beta-barrel protein YwiB (DUF1934 family)|nr:DUF1934 domain-containing protein [Clostridiales bacterium]
MNRNVSIFIEGLVRGEDESSITTKATGVYRMLDDVHILKYMESAVKRDKESDATDKEPVGADEDCVNTIKISSGLVEMIKIGENSTHMVFDLSRSTQSVYGTPYGSLYFQIETKRIDIEEKENELVLNMEYALSHEDSHISDNRIYLTVNNL